MPSQTKPPPEPGEWKNIGKTKSINGKISATTTPTKAKSTLRKISTKSPGPSTSSKADEKAKKNQATNTKYTKRKEMSPHERDQLLYSHKHQRMTYAMTVELIPKV